ncbi:MAG: hypothetical protein WC340_18085, partial [Kiritimatiellia bacterium]
SAVCFGLGNGVSIVPCTRSDILGSGVYQQEKLVAPAESKSRKALVEVVHRPRTGRMLLPRNVWVGKHFGAYTCRWSVHLGRLDNRGVLQGLSDRDAGA